MTSTGSAAAAVLAILLAPGIAAADVPPSGMRVGMPISVIAQAIGTPTTVVSDDTGHRFVFAEGTTAYTDDDGIVLAIGSRTGTPRVDVDGLVRSFRIGTYSTERADAELAAVAEFATSTRKSYRLAPRRDLVLEFGASSQTLERVTYGEPGQLARLGLLPGDGATKAVVYRAPQLRTPAAAAPAGAASAAVYRIAIDRAGNVTDVAVAIPAAAMSGAADPARRLRGERFTPALLDGRPIAATVFVEAAR
jgi:hypothetical protein